MTGRNLTGAGLTAPQGVSWHRASWHRAGWHRVSWHRAGWHRAGWPRAGWYRAGAITAAAGLAVASWALAAVPAGAVPAGAGASAAASWKIVKIVHGSQDPEFTAVTAAGKTAAWAFTAPSAGSSAPAAWRLSGSSWKKAAFPGKAHEQVVSASSASASDVWAITSNFTQSRALWWNGRRWAVKGTIHDVLDDVVALSATNVWAFGTATFPGEAGAWHYNGHSWQRVSSGSGLSGGGAASAGSIWAFGGKNVAHWNGHRWSKTSVASLLPSGSLSDPGVTGIVVRSASNVWAVGTGGRQDEGGPVVVLHYNGHRWSRAAIDTGAGDPVTADVAADGPNDLWIPVPGFDGRASVMLRYAGGRIRPAGQPRPGSEMSVLSVAAVPGSGRALGGGATYRKNQPGTDQSALLTEYH